MRIDSNARGTSRSLITTVDAPDGCIGGATA